MNTLKVTDSEKEAEEYFNVAMKESQNIGSARKEQTPREKQLIAEQHKKMRAALEYKSKQNRKKLNYVLAGKTPAERNKRRRETGIH